MQTLNNNFNAARRVLMMTFYLALSGCAVAGSRGEWFTLGIANRASTPNLIDARLTSSEKNLPAINEAGSHVSYSTQDKLKVPETFTLRWRAEGDAQSQEKVFQVRSKLPVEVIQKLQITEPTHSLSLDFRVKNGLAECLWSLDRLDRNNPVQLAKGAIQ
jgi:hypothetical protein